MPCFKVGIGIQLGKPRFTGGRIKSCMKHRFSLASAHFIMLAVISPAKTLDYESACPVHTPTYPDFLAEAGELIAVLRKKTSSQLGELMGISEKLADLNLQRYRSWQPPFTEDNARAALFAFKGDVYTGFTLETYGAEDFDFSQQHLRILSGLYGLLKPMDLMQPYRLEMGTKLKSAKGKDLYEFWDLQITEAVDAAVDRFRIGIPD